MAQLTRIGTSVQRYSIDRQFKSTMMNWYPSLLYPTEQHGPAVSVIPVFNP